MIAIYRSLGQELENHVAALRKENRTDELQAVLSGLNACFSTQSRRQEDGNNFNSLNSVAARRYFTTRRGHEGEDDRFATRRELITRNAAAADEKILDAIKANPDCATPDAALAVEVQWRRVSAAAATSRKRSTCLADVLKKKPGLLLDARGEAAYTYQDWGHENPRRTPWRSGRT